MTNPIPEEKKKRVIDLYYDGYNFKEISSEVGIAESSVSNILKNHNDGLEKHEKDQIISSSRALRKAGLKPNDVASGAHTSSRLKKLNLDDDESIKLEALIASEAKNQGIEPKVVLQNSYDIIKLSKSIDVPIEELPEHCNILAEEYKKLKQKTQQNLKEKQESDDALKKALKENDAKLEDLVQFGQLKVELTKRGYDSNIDQLVCMIQNAESAKYNPEKILERISKEQSYNDIINEKESEIKSLDYTISAKKKEIASCEKTITQYKPLLDTIQQFKILGVNMTILSQVLADYIVKCQSSKISSKDAIQYLQEHVSETAEIAKLKEYAKKLKHDIDLLESNISEQTQEKTNLDGKIRALKKIKATLESQCNTLKNNNIKYNEAIKENAKSCNDNVVQNAKTQLDNMANTYQNSIDDIESKSKESIEKVKESALNQLIEFTESDAFQNMWMIKTIHKMKEGKADISEIRTLAIMFSTHFDETFKKKGIPVRFTLNSLVQKLLDFDILDKQ